MKLPITLIVSVTRRGIFDPWRFDQKPIRGDAINWPRLNAATTYPSRLGVAPFPATYIQQEKHRFYLLAFSLCKLAISRNGQRDAITIVKPAKKARRGAR